MSAALDLTRPASHPVVEREAPQHHPCHCIRQGWIVATTHSQAERWATENLQRRGYRAYLPLVAIRRRDRVTPSLRRVVHVPLFTGYLFVHHDSRNSWRPIYETPGVRGVIRNGSQIQYAPEAAVSALQADEARRAAPLPPSLFLASGTPVAVSGGPLRGHHAIVVASTDHTAIIQLIMFGELRDVAVDVDCLTARDE